MWYCGIDVSSKKVTWWYLRGAQSPEYSYRERSVLLMRAEVGFPEGLDWLRRLFTRVAQGSIRRRQAMAGQLVWQGVTEIQKTSIGLGPRLLHKQTVRWRA